MKKIIDLTYALNTNIPSWDGGCCFSTSIFLDYKDCTPPNLFRVQKVETRAGCGTHIDAPAHCIEGGKTIEKIEIQELITDCIVVRPNRDVDESYMFTPEDIANFENQHGKIEAGTFVIFHSGWDKNWHTEKFRNDLKFPSVSPDTTKLLLERNISGIGIDTLSPDAVGDDFPVHRMLLSVNKYIVENIANASELPPKGAKLMIMPLKIEGGTEAPVRLVATIE